MNFGVWGWDRQRQQEKDLTRFLNKFGMNAMRNGFRLNSFATVPVGLLGQIVEGPSDAII